IIGGSDCNVFDVDVAVNDIKITIPLRINQRAFKVNGESTITGGGLVRYYAELTNDADNTKAWHLVSSPLSDEIFDTDFANINDIAEGTGSNRGIATYNPGQTGTAAWTYFTGTDVPATPGKGFSMKITPDNVTFAGGEYDNNDVGFEGGFHTDNAGVSITTTSAGFNLLGNPYVAHINSATFLGDASGIDQSQIWVWNQAGNGGDGRYESQMSRIGFILAPAQGFFVDVTTPGNLNFAESNQATTGGTFQKTARTELKLLVSDSETRRSTDLFFLPNVTKGYDFGWEGEVFGGVSNDFELFTHLVHDDEGKKYQKQSLPISEIESLVIPVGMEAASGKELVFSSESQNFPTGLKVFLEDRENNTFTRLDEANSEYKVTLTQPLNGMGRFYIHTATGALSTDDVALENISVYATNKTTLRIVGLSQGKSNLKLYNILGKQVLNTSFTSHGVSEVNLPTLSTGVYIVHLTDETGSFNKKIVLK
ncbi:T9SS type A sorting domain-containing protein, partial [Winogradskyella sp.]|uniref:T9SS type A sorting domain-containing protein n=1 Tax=Winogradskyella sp. TaxID=1883156 RepID=UPI0025FB18E1